MIKLSKEIKENRKARYEVNPLIISRWSPKAMTGEEIPDDVLMSLFEAARWAPSAFNSQPWRFIYAKRDTEHWDRLFDLLNEGNQSWTKNASALMVVLSQRISDYNGKLNKTHAFDTGAAWENLALQAITLGWYAHAMSGVHFDKAREVLEVPEDYDIHAMIAVGKRGDKSILSEEAQKGESPNDRKKIEEFIMEGKFIK